ncbi:MAG: hypothetical protein BZY88_04760 [SAR202 cluster bacterium Io17-Chloro-G9]|nr:MAG: hypothetical protein BZY88_04760 [SAR202 cluster bacterium Io17-Chloro-G9]
MSRNHVVFGAAGALGGAIVRRLDREGEQVCAVVRDLERARRLLPPSVDIRIGDATSAESVRVACRNADVIYHCVNVPEQKWATVMTVATDNILAAVREAKAWLVYPGSIHGYGPFRNIPATEDHPLGATTTQGKLRNTIERKLVDANLMGDAKVVIPRFPDFYGPNVANRMVVNIFEAALAGKKAKWPGKLDVPHDMIYVDDAASACFLLGANEDSFGQVWHVPGPGPLTGQQFMEIAFAKAGTKPKLGTRGNGLSRIITSIAGGPRELGELRYEFKDPLVLDGSKFVGAYPSFEFTPHEEAIQRTCEWFGQRLTLGR